MRLKGLKKLVTICRIMIKTRLLAAFFLFLGIGAMLLVVASEPALKNVESLPAPIKSLSGASETLAKFPFRLGLDLSGGTALTYKADLTKVAGEKEEAMDALRDVIERRVNLFGVSEPLVRTAKSAFGGEERLLVELPGVTDISRAVAMIGETPTLEFKIERPEGPEKEAIIKAYQEAQASLAKGENPAPNPLLNEDPFLSTGLTGKYLKRASLMFNGNTGQPEVSLNFDSEGAKLFEKITKENVGRIVAIYLDGAPISTPVVQGAISGGTAQITGNFTPLEAKTLVGRLNSGALPVPISLIGTNAVPPSLGAAAIEKAILAGLSGLVMVAIFLLFWYRLPGLIAILALAFYIAVMLLLFKLIPVTLTAAGLAGFIISIGMAVDANILIFERMKEEIRSDKPLEVALADGFERAFTSIRDANLSSIISAVILFWFGTSVIKGFALVFCLGVVMSMLSAITLSRVFLKSLGFVGHGRVKQFLFSSGFAK